MAVTVTVLVTVGVGGLLRLSRATLGVATARTERSARAVAEVRRTCIAEVCRGELVALEKSWCVR